MSLRGATRRGDLFSSLYPVGSSCTRRAESSRPTTKVRSTVRRARRPRRADREAADGADEQICMRPVVPARDCTRNTRKGHAASVALLRRERLRRGYAASVTLVPRERLRYRVASLLAMTE